MLDSKKIMLDSKKIVKVVSVVVASISMMGVGASVSEAASFTAPKAWCFRSCTY